MRKFLLSVVALSVSVVLLAGCGEPDADATARPPEQAFNAVQFFDDFALAPPEVKSLADSAWKSIQLGAFSESLKSLEKLADNPALNEPQRKSVTKLTEQVKSHMAANTSGRWSD